MRHNANASKSYSQPVNCRTKLYGCITTDCLSPKSSYRNIQRKQARRTHVAVGFDDFLRSGSAGCMIRADHQACCAARGLALAVSYSDAPGLWKPRHHRTVARLQVYWRQSLASAAPGNDYRHAGKLTSHHHPRYAIPDHTLTSLFTSILY